MPDIQPFRGLRYELMQVGDLTNVVCPPYDVIDPALHERLYKMHPANFVRVELNRPEPGDAPDAKYARARGFLDAWKAQGVLVEENRPAIYVYHQIFETDGATHTRRGFMARCRLSRFGEGQVFPHEETMSGPKADRLLLMKACKANLSQIFGLFPDPTNEVQNLLERHIADTAPVEAKDHLGVTHRMWVVTDAELLSHVTRLMSDKKIFIADGHHRYDTACNYRDELKAAGQIDEHSPANFVLMMCIGMDDPGLLVLPTHRLFRGLTEMSAMDLADKVAPYFKTRLAGEGPEAARSVWEDIETSGNQGMLGLYTAKDERWTIAEITDAGKKKIAEVAPEHSADWQSLGVSILHRLLIETILGGKDLPKPKYVHSIDEVIDSLGTGDVAGRDATGVESKGGRFELSALVMPATVEHIREISMHKEVMPAKSTYFYPKLLGGMVVNPIE